MIGDQSIHEIIELLVENERAAGQTLCMVPSENGMSALAKLPLLLDVYHRYFFNRTGDPGRWGFRGGELTGPIETQVTDRVLAELGAATHVNTRPLSGLNGMTLVLAALGGPPGSTVLTVSADNGGHYATKSIAARMGLRVEFLPPRDTHTVDHAAVRELVAATRPTLVYVDQSNCLFPLDIAELTDSVRRARPDTTVHVDASHWMGLVLGGVQPNPLEAGADSFSGSTHKTFPGPQKAVFLTRREDLAELVREAEDYLISSHHFAATLSLGLALLEFRDFGGARYARDVVANTRRFAEHLHRHGVPVEAAERGFSAGHQLWLDTDARIGRPAHAVGARLSRAGIRVNVQPELPGIDHPVVRVGLNEATFHGLVEQDIDELADVFVAAVLDTAPAGMLADRVAALRAHPARPYGFASHSSERLVEQAMRMWEDALAGPAHAVGSR
jgi:glycine/serine hydroxymethyltransferase